MTSKTSSVEIFFVVVILIFFFSHSLFQRNFIVEENGILKIESWLDLTWRFFELWGSDIRLFCYDLIINRTFNLFLGCLVISFVYVIFQGNIRPLPLKWRRILTGFLFTRLIFSWPWGFSYNILIFRQFSIFLLCQGKRSGFLHNLLVGWQFWSLKFLNYFWDFPLNNSYILQYLLVLSFESWCDRFWKGKIGMAKGLFRLKVGWILPINFSHSFKSCIRYFFI